MKRATLVLDELLKEATRVAGGKTCSGTVNLAIEDAVEFEEIVTCLPVIKEVLQGFREGRPRPSGL
jgi:hypothetical protein